jgi:hypothetical protein
MLDQRQSRGPPRSCTIRQRKKAAPASGLSVLVTLEAAMDMPHDDAMMMAGLHDDVAAMAVADTELLAKATTVAPISVVIVTHPNA